MKKLVVSTIILATALVAFVSCEKKPIDNQDPVIELKAPEDDEPIKPGSDIHFEAVLSDNVSLKSYKINIHGAFDGHTHGAVARATDVAEFSKTWTEEDFIKLGDKPIVGQKKANLHHHHLVIPKEVNGKPIREGHYHFMIYCTDEAGNESFVAREIVISSTAEEHDHHHHH